MSPADERIPHQIDDDVERAFPGRQITHVIRVVSCGDISATLAALLSLDRPTGCALLAFHMNRRCDRFEHKLMLAGVRTAQVRQFYERVAALDGVERATLEHQILRSESLP